MSSKKPIACRYANKCTKNDCIFVHPKKPIACRYANKCTKNDCIFVHPKKPIACRYADKCIRKDCIFDHEQQAFCRDGDKCLRSITCKFRHANFCSACQYCENVNCQLEHLSTYESMPQCKFGEKCNNKNCYYKHSEPNDIVDLFPEYDY